MWRIKLRKQKQQPDRAGFNGHSHDDHLQDNGSGICFQPTLMIWRSSEEANFLLVATIVYNQGYGMEHARALHTLKNRTIKGTSKSRGNSSGKLAGYPCLPNESSAMS